MKRILSRLFVLLLTLCVALGAVGYTGFVSAEVSKCGKEQSYEDYYRATREQIDAIIK